MILVTPHGYRNGEKVSDLKNAQDSVQALLKDRDPAGEKDWTKRYAHRFKTLFDSDDDFRNMLLEELTDSHLRKIQDCLDAPK